MTIARWIECACGLLAALLGFLALGIEFFAPVVSYVKSSSNGVTISGMTSYAQAGGGVIFPIILFGLPLAAIGLGATFHALRASAAARTLLWIATILLTALAVLAMLSIGPSLLPSVVLAIAASAVAFGNRRPVNG